MSEQEAILTVKALSKEFQKDGKVLHALENVSFELCKGEVLGVIGRNGAGKSTLLKVLSRITGPSSGEVTYEGQLTSIIDIGTGFHADLSGEENIYLSALLLGYSKKEIKGLYEDIVEFSGLHDFMQMPVKHYSSGMYLRLAFSIAFHSKISILLLDEVIAVGDTDFRRKCYSKIKELKARGTAIILVSHHLELVVEQCDRCLLLDDGKILSEGSPLEVVDQYYALIDSNEGAKIRSEIKKESIAEDLSLISDFPLQVEHFQIDNLNIEHAGKDKLTTASVLNLHFNCTKLLDEGSFEIGLYLVNMNGIRVLLDSPAFRNDYKTDDIPKGNYLVEVTVPADLLSAGVYRVGVMMSVNRKLVKDFDSIAKFRIYPDDTDFAETRGMGSVIRPKLVWSIKSI
jgi:lipopolysaccharide transport system ATP-binding protein